MSTERENALAALREWSVPGRRADLVAAAWNAGATVVAIAEAARVGSRQTIYDDLKSRGIDPRNRSREKNVTAVTVEGLNGVDDNQPGGPLYAAVVAKHEGRPAPSKEEFGRMMALSLALAEYNDLRARLTEEENTRAERDRALHLVDVRWEALADPNSKGSWLHGHQAYVRAVDDAHRVIDAWKAAAETLMRQASLRRGEDADRLVDAYEQYILAAGHPPVTKPDIDAEAEAARLHEELDVKHNRRKTLAAETLGLATQH
ncbi:hypothetical protein [Streptomyces hygroscopicus]|uniref:hypothetical protein n=1 Tax=Streptomyces hygroscopicus TaxID=1912 RepID=UPI000780D770|nr:hypothetical protein [Streptomyces hygroscopicus]